MLHLKLLPSVAFEAARLERMPYKRWMVELPNHYGTKTIVFSLIIF